MDKTYKPQESEDKIYKMWEKAGYFIPKIDPKKKPFCIIMPPPNANGVLHVGHAVFVTLEDIMIRYHRMKGDAALWVPGADHAGIATQVVYEKKLAKEGKTRFDLGREEFVKQIYEFSIKNKETMENQLRKLGASCDWARAKFTLDPKISKSVLFTFKKLYDEGLIYRGPRIINWCPRCQTALSDLEVQHKEKPTKLYYIRYPILRQAPLGSARGKQDKFVGSNEFVVVATTRPETMLGDTAVAVHPNDEKWGKIKNVKLKLPLTGRIINTVADDRIDPKFGTGVVKVTPAHDPLDFEISKKWNLPAINVVGQDGKMTKEAGKSYEGLSVKEAREKVLQDLKELGLLEKEENYKSPISICERCKATIEPLISKQWFVKAKELAGPAMDKVNTGAIKFVPKRFEKLYYHWMENIRDWCISRQIWWGHRIPVWYCECGKAIVEVEPPKKCPKCKSKKLTQDTDTLDTWFSSGQWPFNVFGWPKETDDFKYFYPTTVMETGWDILFFWVARMIMLGIYCTEKPPFHYVYLHGLVRDKDRQKMSKSRGNVIDPLGVIDLHGADALRMALVFGTGPGNDVIISEEKIIAHRKFANKIWNAARFVLGTQNGNFQFSISNFQSISNDKILKQKITDADRNILKALKETTTSVSKNIDKFRFHQAAETLYHFFWHTFCDKYIEASKKQTEQGSDEEKENTKQILLHVLLTSLKLLHPFMPFVTEQIYQLLPNRPKNALIIEDWPRA